jgi:cytochrome b561
MTSFRYATGQVAVHWLAAAAVLFLLLTGTLLLEDMPNTAPKVANLRIHMLVGALAGLLVVVRVLLRRSHPLPPPMPGERVVRWGHLGLNLLVLLMAFSGAMLALQSGLLDALWGNGTLPSDFRAFTPRRVHGLLAKLTMALVALHVLAALYHQFVLRDGLLGRMGLGRKGGS